MPWNSVWPNGNQSVKQNETPGAQNTTYTETTMNVDHFWNIGTNEDGHHQFAQMPAFEVGGSPGSPTLATGMDGVYFNRLKTISESVAQQDVQPYYRNDSAIMQLLGIRACALFDVDGVGTVTLQYNHNVSTVVRQAAGRFEITYTTALPSDNYFVNGGAMKNTTNAVFEPLIVSVTGGASVAARKNTGACIVLTALPTGVLADPLQAWFVMFGG